MHVHTHLYTDGDWLDPLGDATIDVISPYTEEIVGRVPDGTPADIERAVAAARAAFDTGPWPRLPVADRADLLDRAADLLERRGAEVGALIIAEMGSPASFVAAGQVPAPIAFLRAAAALAREFPFEEHLGEGGRTLVLHEPVGVVACVVPSNFPLLLAVAQVAPAIAAGCCVVLKPAPESPLDTYVLAEILREVGLPPGVVNIVPGGSVAGTHLVRHPQVDKVAYTGSAAVGRQVAAWCGERLARVSLELGGKSAAIILDDAPLERTVADLLPMAFLNSGQACVAQTRILVSRRRHDEFVDAFAEAVAAMTVGDPADLGTQIGPLLARRQRDRVEGYLDIGRDAGAKIVTGGGRPASQPRGWFVEPTLFVGVDNSMRIAREEIFGPVVCVLDYDHPDEAVAIANDSEYGLSGSVWTADVAAGVDIARRVRTGMVSVNGAFQSPDAPFGGFKNSGIGRECGTAGFSLYLETKSVGLPPLD
ncbi:MULTISPECIES: aldehyde dehydrogenase [Pseudofrankia]|uniref:aldehyde dehydrogenase n=1 Tax=Pseudofrankia TaxID=2994363 RepID=UPI000234D069|nr:MULTISPECIES: aldehyde dehydrogenase [Pseudofrankia]OHV31549.1 aldehyde dehydrogenase [Pseudofrankia sp. EUN1h]